MPTSQKLEKLLQQKERVKNDERYPRRLKEWMIEKLQIQIDEAVAQAAQKEKG